MGWDAMNKNEGIMEHLLFHKALIDDNVGSEKIDRYMRILAEDVGETMPDPVDESIRSVFRMVLEHDFDPWSIDLSEFVRLYANKIAEHEVDIIVAGKLIRMAWRVLRMQSDATLLESERDEQEVLDWGFDIDADFFDEKEELYVPSVMLQEAFHRSPTRAVTMFEFLDAFEEAREEMEMMQERELVRLQLQAKEPKKFDNKAHEEDDKREVERVWRRIQRFGTGPLSISDLYTSDVRENITIFVSVLHLVRDGQLAIWQDEMPYGQIFVEIKMDYALGKVEDQAVQMVEGVI